MMRDGTNVNQREIVFIPFPFTDLSGNKKRPVLILSGKDYNSKNEDFICCALTSNPENFRRGIKILDKDLDSGSLNYDSAVIPCKLFTPNKSLVLKNLGILGTGKSKEVVKFLNLNIKIEE